MTSGMGAREKEAKATIVVVLAKSVHTSLAANSTAPQPQRRFLNVCPSLALKDSPGQSDRGYPWRRPCGHGANLCHG